MGKTPPMHRGGYYSFPTKSCTIPLILARRSRPPIGTAAYWIPRLSANCCRAQFGSHLGVLSKGPSTRSVTDVGWLHPVHGFMLRPSIRPALPARRYVVSGAPSCSAPSKAIITIRWVNGSPINAWSKPINWAIRTIPPLLISSCSAPGSATKPTIVPSGSTDADMSKGTSTLAICKARRRSDRNMSGPASRETGVFIFSKTRTIAVATDAPPVDISLARIRMAKIRSAGVARFKFRAHLTCDRSEATKQQSVVPYENTLFRVYSCS